MDAEFDMSKICRCCRQQGPGLQSIFRSTTTASSSNTSLLTMLITCFQIQIRENDGLPEQLCAKCAACVSSAYDFRQRYLQSDACLRGYLLSRGRGNDGENPEAAAAMLCGMSVKVELSDVKGEQIFVEATNPLLEEFEDDDDDEADAGRRKKVEEVKSERVDSDDCAERGEAGVDTDDDSDYVGDGGGGASSDDSEPEDAKPAATVLEKRKRIRKPSSVRHECPICGSTFGRTYHLNRHLKTHGKDTQCKLCEQRFPIRAYKDYQRHMAEEHPGAKPVKKSAARAKTEKSESLKVAAKSTDFPISTETSVVKSELIISDHEGATDEDGGSSQDSSDSEPVVAKKKRIRKPPTERKACPICSRTFGRNYHLKRHIKTHRNDTRCQFCEQRFSTAAYKDYRRHMAEEHPGEPLLPFKKPKDEDGEFVDEEGNPTASSAGTRKRRQCPFCDRAFKNKNHLDRHIPSHKNDTQCEFCERKFTASDYKDYKQHMLEEHPGMAVQPFRKIVPSSVEEAPRKQAICTICDTSFPRIAELRIHLKSHVDPTTLAKVDIPTKPYLFQEGYVLENYLEYLVQQICKWDVLRFYQIVEPDGEELELSDSDSEPEDEMLAIPGTVHREHTCAVCNESFPRLKHILEHAREQHSPGQLLRCQHCGHGSPNSALLQRHLKQQCENTHKKFQCALCSKKFMWQTSLNKHTRARHGPPKDPSGEEKKDTVEKPFHCQLCNKAFAEIHHLRWHRRVHMPSEERFPCPKCPRKFDRSYNLKVHMRRHQEVREEPKQTHLCSLCGRGFTSNYNYVVHMRRHNGERPFKCDMCDKAFPRSMDLTTHRRTHTGEKPNICKICGKAFSRHNILARHMRIHTGARPYACTYCDRTFTQSNDLTLHVRRHTGEKPYSCPICNERFIQGTALRIHQRATGHLTEDAIQPVSTYGQSVLEGMME